MELLYIWIGDNPIDTLQQEFCFTPEYDIYLDTQNDALIIEKKNTLNIFKKDTILNISGIVGENGTGKTTLLNKLGNMSDTRIKPKNKSKIKKEFIAVFYDNGFVILNSTNHEIYFNSHIIHCFETYSSSSKYNEDSYLDQLSKVYLTNSELTGENYYSKQGKLDYINLSNKTLQVLGKDYFKLKGTLDNQYALNNIKINIMQSIFPNFIDNRFHSLIDINFLVYVKRLKNEFIGKDISNIQFKIDKITDYISSDLEDLDYYKRDFHKNDVEEFERKFEILNKHITLSNKLESSLVMNLTGELIYCYSEFSKYVEDCNTIELLHNKCKQFITEYLFENTKEKEYFENAIKEIDEFKGINYKRKGKYYISGINSFWNLINKFVFKKYSFILKYIHIIDEYTSSGERAILNFMSRIYFLSRMDDYLGKNIFELSHNVLLLIDEIDLYLHPAWQQKIIKILINELNECFPNYKFQIIFSTHSPIVLSNIPTQNCIFLKKNTEGKVIKKEVGQTFGCNIFNLYKDAFFLENGNTIGEYAKDFINQLAKDIKDKDHYNEYCYNKENINKKIDLIGEPIIQNHLRKLINEPKKNKIDSSQKNDMIRFLEKQKREIENKINELKKQ